MNLLVFALLLSNVWAVLQVTGPTSGSEYTASGGRVTIPIKWKDDAYLPSLDYVDSITFVLCTGPNSKIKPLNTIKAISMDDLDGDVYNAVFDSSVAADGLFYVQLYAALKNADGSIIQYTPRVLLSGMTGSLAPSGEDQPPQGSVSLNNAVDISKSFTVPYTEQTGKTRYAPMQMQPDSTITATTWSRRFPTSAVSYFKSPMGTGSCSSTITPGWSYTMSSLVNMATPAPFPSVVGWYPASERLVSATLNGNHQHQRRKRWDD